MKLVIGKPEKEAEKEPIVHVWLAQGCRGEVVVRAELAGSTDIRDWRLLSISKHGIRRSRQVSPHLGFPLDSDGRLQLHS